MDEISQAVTPSDAPSEVSDTSLSPEANDRVGSNGATEVPVDSPEGSDAAASAAPAIQFPTDEELQAAPPQWRDRFGNLKTGYDSLEADHKSLKAQHDELRREAEAAQAFYSGLFTPAVDEATGRPLYHEETGLPLVDTRPALEQLQGQSRETFWQLARDILSFTPEGTNEPILNQAMRLHGLDPARLDEYRRIDELRANSDAASQPGVSPEDLAQIPQEYHKAYQSLPPSVREELAYMREAARNQVLANQAKIVELDEWRAAQQAEQERAQAAQVEQFKQQTQAAVQERLSQVTRESYDALRQNLAAQWQPTADDATNQLHYDLALNLTLNLTDPNARFATENILKATGVQLGSDFDEKLALAQQKYAEAVWFEAYGDKARAQASLAVAAQARQMVTAKLSGVALKVAALLDGRNRDRAAQASSALSASAARPTINGAQASSQTNVPDHIRRNPFSPEARQFFYGQ